MTIVANTCGLLPGFADPVMDAQGVFRALLSAMAQPGTAEDLALDLRPPAPLAKATAALVLALADFETPVWLDAAARTAAVTRHLRFHCGCPLVSDSRAAAFAIIAAPEQMPPLAAFAAGSDAYPDRSATIIIQVPSFTGGTPWRVRGPGIRVETTLAIAGLAADFGQWSADNHASFPCGVDVVFTCGSRLVGLPRSASVEVLPCTSR